MAEVPEFWRWLVDIAHHDDTDLDDLDVQELGDLFVRLDEVIGVLLPVTAKVRRALAERLDTPLALRNGWVLAPRQMPRRTGWRNVDLAQRLADYCTRSLVDPDTGERVAVLDPVKVRSMFDPTHAVTKLRAAGIDPTDYCEEAWEATVEIVR